MTPEEKQLLLTDLCARLPYGLKCKIDIDALLEVFPEYGARLSCVATLKDVDLHAKTGESLHFLELVDSYGIPVECVKPYFRPMSSMTDDERKDWYMQSKVDYDCEFKPEPTLPLEHCHLSVDWLNKKGFDYRGLIPMGLALEANEWLYN